MPDDLDPQIKEFTVGLRQLVDRSGLDVAALADRTGYGTTSWERYLGGRLLAPKGAVIALAEVTGAPPGPLTTLWELAERAWSRAELRDGSTLQALRIAEGSDPKSAGKGTGPGLGKGVGRAVGKGAEVSAGQGVGKGLGKSVGKGARAPGRAAPVPPWHRGAPAPAGSRRPSPPSRRPGTPTPTPVTAKRTARRARAARVRPAGTTPARHPTAARHAAAAPAGRAGAAGARPPTAAPARGRRPPEGRSPKAVPVGVRPVVARSVTVVPVRVRRMVAVRSPVAPVGRACPSRTPGAWPVTGGPPRRAPVRVPGPRAGRTEPRPPPRPLPSAVRPESTPPGPSAPRPPAPRPAPPVPPRGAPRRGALVRAPAAGGDVLRRTGRRTRPHRRRLLLHPPRRRRPGRCGQVALPVGLRPGRSAPGVKCAGSACTGKDAEAMGCGGEQVTTAKTATVGTTTLEVRYSKVCGTAWGRITSGAPGDTVRVTAGGERQTGDITAVGDTIGYTPMVAVRNAAQARACATLASGQKGCTE
ncbi:DUF2690 domain-containing protein [Streptomyces nogalater]